jgi:hypothetical protein
VRISRDEHTSRPWRIHEFTPDFRVEDVWALPATGAGPNDFARHVRGMLEADFEHEVSPIVSALFAIRWKLGEFLGWDRHEEGLGERVPTLRDRLPIDLGATAPEAPDGDRFTPLYLLRDEYAAEIANKTMHGVLHLGWVPDGSGGYRGQMAVLVKPNGAFGHAYMAAIKPFRHLFVYPALMRFMERSWRRQLQPAA